MGTFLYSTDLQNKPCKNAGKSFSQRQKNLEVFLNQQLQLKMNWEKKLN